ncbi:MAG: MBL fold metallo-hydrolase [Desulfobacterales bacterium]
MYSDMIVTILGSGTCVPSLDRSSCAVLVETGTSVVLLDSGAGTMRRLLEAGRTIFELSHICYSHFHPDHSGELAPLLFATKYPDRRRRRRPLTICAGAGFSDFFNGLKNVYGRWIDLDAGMLQLFELDTGAPDALRFEDFTLKSLPVDHNPESLAYRITDARGRAVVYTGDSDVCENLVAIARNADLFICESSLPDAQKVDGHLTPSLAGEMATRATVGRLVLTHFYPECDEADIEKECRKTFSGPLVLARDLMRFKLS